MRDECLRAEQYIANEAIEAYKDQGVLEYVSKEMRYQLGRELSDKISDGNSYIVMMGEEYKVQEFETNRTRISRTIHVSKLIRCMNCRYTPPVDEEFIFSGAVSHLYCRRLGEKVHPRGFCAWAEDRPDHVQIDCPWR